MQRPRLSTVASPQRDLPQAQQRQPGRRRVADALGELKRVLEVCLGVGQAAVLDGQPAKLGQRLYPAEGVA